ncbi:MAG: aminoglycoside phosphotransferase family protein [Cohnella sp.]|nr:aminoglycoside phosphotransferase family protein [Cohnella sp.]
MEGIYKTKLSAEQLNAAVRQAFGQSLTKYSELTDGWANSAYAITLSDGERVVLKARPANNVRSMRCEPETMKTEVEVLRLLSGLEGFPVPKLRAHDDTLKLLPVEYFIMDYVEGDPYVKVKDSLPPETRAGIEEQLGRLTRAMNSFAGKRFGYFPDSAGKHDSWRAAFSEMIMGVLMDGEEAGIALPVPYEELREAIGSRLHVLDEVTVPQLVHWDLWDGNFFVKDGVITGIVDFERARWGDPIMEMYFGKFVDSEAHSRGYGLSLSEPSQIARRKLYDLYLDLILDIECVFRKYENEGHVRWARDNLKDGIRSFLESHPARY